LKPAVAFFICGNYFPRIFQQLTKFKAAHFAVRVTVHPFPYRFIVMCFQDAGDNELHGSRNKVW
jgi:hypothetical protein